MTYEWHTDGIRVHTSDIGMTYKCIQVLYGWHLCSPQPISLVNSKLTQLENKLSGKIMAMKSYFMDEVHNICAEIVNCENKT